MISLRRAAGIAATAALMGGAAMMAAGTASATATPAATPATAGAVSLGLGGMCLDNRLGAATPGNPVQIWRCLGNSNQQWQFWPDGSVRPAAHPGMELSLNTSDLNPAGHPYADLATVPASAGTVWQPTAGRALLTSLSGGYNGLNDPGFSTSNGTRVIGYPATGDAGGAAGANSQWTPPAAHYATTKLTSVPDAGVANGGFWALDSGSVINSLVWTGRDSSGALTYDGAQAESASFLTMPGDPQPNNTASASAKIGDVLPGSLSGYYLYTLTASHFVSSQPPASESGMGAWAPAVAAPDSFFATSSGDGVTAHGTKSGVWDYTTAADNCGNTESMTQTDTNGAWDNQSGWTATGNIPAYAPAGANYAGGQTCPAS